MTSETRSTDTSSHAAADKYWRARTILEFAKLAAWIVFQAIWDNVRHN